MTFKRDFDWSYGDKKIVGPEKNDTVDTCRRINRIGLLSH